MIQDQGFICGTKEFNFHYFVYYWFLKSLHFLYRIKSAAIKYTFKVSLFLRAKMEKAIEDFRENRKKIER